MEKDREFSSFKNYQFVAKKTKITNERQAVLSEFLEEINNERIGTQWKPISPRVLALKVSHMTVNDLYFFLKKCREYRSKNGSFSKCFFGALKPLQEN